MNAIPHLIRRLPAQTVNRIAAGEVIEWDFAAKPCRQLGLSPV